MRSGCSTRPGPDFPQLQKPVSSASVSPIPQRNADPAARAPFITNGTDWRDTRGRPISCHDGCILRVGDEFYWYGTSYRGNPRGLWGRPGAKLQNDFNVYRSRDLVSWEYAGVCFSFPKHSWLSEGTSHRPNVLYNEGTRKFVLWFFCMAKADPEYPDVMLAVAEADEPAGPFRFVARRESGEEHGWGQDLGLFKDDDGSAYLVYDDGHRNIRVDLLSDDYLSSTRRGAVALPPTHEGAAMIKIKGRYLVAGSGVFGWAGSETHGAVADAPLGPYGRKQLLSQRETWGSQISNFLPIRESGSILAICDQWWGGDAARGDLEKSRYLFLPVDLDPASNTASLCYRERWNPFAPAQEIW